MKFVSNLPAILIASSLSLVAFQPAYAQVAQVTDIQLVPTVDGVELLLETTGGTLEGIRQTRENLNLILEIPNAQLNIPEGRFERINPVPGIQSILVAPVDANNIRVTLVGETDVPNVEFQTTPQGFTFSVTPTNPAPVSEEPSEEPSEELGEEPEEIEIVVTATRTEENITNVPRSVTVINREQIEAQRRLTPDIGTTLGKLVPGLAPPTQSASGFGQSLRGRNVLVLIDGVPQSTSRNVFRDFRTIDPSAIERIEVLRGPTALYGDGATGGVINIITRRATAERLNMTTEIGVDSSLTNFADSVGYFVGQTVSGNEGNVDYVLSAAFSGNGGFFDAQGDRIPPDPNAQGGIADTDNINILAKFGVQFTDDQRLQFSFNHFVDTQNTDFTVDPSVDELEGRRKARAISGLELDEPQTTNNTLVNLTYNHDNLLGSQVQAQGYYRNYLTRFFPFDARNFDSFGNTIIQSQVESEKFGGRLQIDTPLFDEGSARLLWGADYFFEDSVQPVSTFDEEAFDASGGLRFNKVGNRIWSPPLELSSLGLFAQFNWNISDRVILNGGVRHERAGVSVEDFTTLAGDDITGGDLNFDDTLFNAGIVYNPTPNIGVFANFSQGFSLADIGRVLRAAPAGLSVRELNPEPQKVNSYEVGIRGQWRNVQASVAGFYNQSDLGTTFDEELNVIRAPERIYGVEGTLNTRLGNRWVLGGTASWTEGQIDIGEDDDYTDLDSFRIPPIKLTAYVQHQTTPGWSNRLQVLYSGGRNPEGSGYGRERVYDYITADFLSSIQIGEGTLSIGVENLFNTYYFPVVSQSQGFNSGYAAARGTTLSLRYTFNW